MPETTILLQPGKTYAVKVRGINGPVKGPWSEPIYLEVSTDETAPTAPNNLTAAAVPAGLKLKWANPAEADIKYCRIYVSASSIPVGSDGRVTGVDPMVNVDADMVVILNLNPGTWYARVEAVDHAGNRSPASGEVSVSVGQSAIADHSDTSGTANDGEARAKINQILAVLRAHKLIAN